MSEAERVSMIFVAITLGANSAAILCIKSQPLRSFFSWIALVSALMAALCLRGCR